MSCCRQSCQAFHTQQIALFAEFDPTGLLDFLQRLHRIEGSFNPTYALTVCRRRRAQLHSPPKAGSATSSQKGRYDSVEASEQDGQHTEGAILGLYAAEVYLLCHLGRHRETLDILVNKLRVS